MLDTDQLRSFLAIVDTGSFRRAGERVNKTQSAVSMHIRRLEEQLNCLLFAKQGRGVRLSEDGEKLIDYARRMLHIESHALAAIAHKGLAGRVRFGIPDDYADPLLAQILTRFTSRNPLVEVSVVCEPSVEIAARVAGRDVDLAVVTDCAAIHGVEILRQEAMRWVKGRCARFDREAPLPLALGGPTCGWRHSALAALRQASIPARILLASNNYAAIAPVVRAGLAITVVPEYLIAPGLEFAGPDMGLPDLPPCQIGLRQAPGEQTREAAAMAGDIRAALRENAPMAGAMRMQTAEAA